MWPALTAAVLLMAPAPNPSAPPPSRIVFASARTGVAQLYSGEPSGAGLAQLTFGAGNWGFPVLSPDGRFVAAFRGPDLWLPYTGALVQAPRPELWLMRADGGGARLVSPYAAGAYWSSDSRRLVFASAVGDTPTDDLQPLAVDEGRSVVRRTDGSLDLLSFDGALLRTFEVSSLGAVLAGDDLVVLVRGQLRDYSASSGELLYVWPLPDAPSSGRCRLTGCLGIRLTLDDAARGVVVYTLDGVVHLLRLSSGADVTVPGATAAELTDAGLFYAYAGEEPWPGRIRFVPFDELLQP
jgi:hypothetical protein